MMLTSIHLKMSAGRYFECHYSKDQRISNYEPAHAYVTDKLQAAQTLASSDALLARPFSIVFQSETTAFTQATDLHYNTCIL